MTLPVWVTILTLFIGWGLGMLQEAVREVWRHRREQTERRREEKRQTQKELQTAVADWTVRLEAILARQDADAKAEDRASEDISKAGWHITVLASRLADPDLLGKVRALRA